MSEIRAVHEIPINILQEFIIILRTNEKFVGEGKVEDYYIVKNEKTACIIYDDNKVSYIANFVKDKQDNWFFNSRISVRPSLKESIKKEIIEEFFPNNDPESEEKEEKEE